MKKKILFQILLIFLLMNIGVFALTLTSNASEATISVPETVKKGENFTVTLVLPSDAVGYQGKIKITYVDGTTDISENFFKVTGLDGPYAHPGNMSATFNAKIAGNAYVTLENCTIPTATSEKISVPSGKGFSIVEDIPPAATPEPPTTPANNNNNNNNNQVAFRDVNENVYTTERVNLRKSYSTSSEKITTLAKDTKLTRTGVADNGWSRVNYNGQTAYIYTKYLVTKNEEPKEEKPDEKEVKIKDVKETMYAVSKCNLRKSWTTDSDKAGYLTKGQEVTRTGVVDNGWSRIEYNGNTVFVKSSLISKEKPSEEPDEKTEEPEQTSPEETPAEKTELQILQEEIGVLPEVGNNVATISYIITTIIAVLGSCVGLYFVKKDVE